MIADSIAVNASRMTNPGRSAIAGYSEVVSGGPDIGDANACSSGAASLFDIITSFLICRVNLFSLIHFINRTHRKFAT